MKKQLFRIMLTALVMACLFVLPAGASAKIKSASYEGRGKVDVDFASRVDYRNVKVQVKDEKGRNVKAVILDKDNDDIDFRMSAYKQGKTYSFTIKGVRKHGEKAYGCVKGTIKIPITTGPVPVGEVSYDASDSEVEIEFLCKVEWKNPKVKIFDGKKQYAIRINVKEPREIEIIVKKLKKGKEYQYQISGIRKAGKGAYATISGTFIA